MGFGDLIWILVVLSFLQPILHKRVLEARRQRLIASIEKQRGSRVILLVHRQETMSLLGFPLLRYIDINDSEEVSRAIQMTDPRVPLDVVLHTPGGLVLASLQIARALNRHEGKVTVFVPHYAMSGGTLIALAADEIVMTAGAVLGPLDPQIGQVPAVSVLQVVARKPIAEIDDHTLILADQAEKAIAQLRASVREILDDKLPADKADELAELLTHGAWTHDYAIPADAVKGFGLNVSTAMPPEVLRLMDYFPQPMRAQPGVEYLPTPRRYERREPASGGARR